MAYLKEQREANKRISDLKAENESLLLSIERYKSILSKDNVGAFDRHVATINIESEENTIKYNTKAIERLHRIYFSKKKKHDDNLTQGM